MTINATCLAPESQIDLAWRQKLAAYWSITWPAWLVPFLLAFLLVPFEFLESHLTWISTGETLLFFAIQALLTQRLVRKNYRSFRLAVVRDSGPQSRALTVREAFRVWLWILGPQLAFVLAFSILLSWYSSRIPAETFRSISSASLWLRFLVVGPYAVGLAVRAEYPGFRLHAYGQRYI